MHISRPIAFAAMVVAVASLAAWQRPSQALPSAIAPQHLVNLAGTVNVTQLPIAPLYSVPSDAWLVVTDVDFEHTYLDLGVIDQSGYRRLLLGDDNFDSYRSSVGLAFPPGSQVALAQRSPGSFRDLNWNLTGYLTRP